MSETDPVAEVMCRRARSDFLPPDRQRSADIDAPVSIGHHQTNSQPSTVAAMLRWLNVHPGQHVLDVGSGSGWTSALLGDLVGRGGWVLGVERIPELVESARDVLADMDLPWVSIRLAEADVLGAPDHAPYDRILVSAEAHEVPEELVAQLGPGGVMVVPVAGEMHRVVRDHDGVHVTRHGRFRFVPLVSGPAGDG